MQALTIENREVVLHSEYAGGNAFHAPILHELDLSYHAYQEAVNGPGKDAIAFAMIVQSIVGKAECRRALVNR